MNWEGCKEIKINLTKGNSLVFSIHIDFDKQFFVSFGRTKTNPRILKSCILEAAFLFEAVEVIYAIP